MPVDTAAKKASWVRRIVTDAIAAADAIRKANQTADEYVTNAFNGGDQVNRPEYQITDEDLVAAGFPHLNATKLNQLIGGVEALETTYDANAGVIEASRP